MNKLETLQLSKNEIRFMFLLALFTCLVTILSLIFIVNQLPHLSKNNQEINREQVFRGLIVIICVFIGPMIIENIFLFRKEIRINSNTPFLYKTMKKVFFGVSIILSILYTISFSGSLVNKIGIDSVFGFEIFDLICYGVFVWLIIGFVFIVIDKYIYKIDNFWETIKDDVYLYLNGRTKLERFVSALIMPLSIISEEILYRGYLVLYLGNIYNAFLLFGFSSIILSVLSHLYQGKGRIISNLIFASAMVFITIITGKILLAITVHLLNNYLVMFTRWRISNKKKDPKRI